MQMIDGAPQEKPGTEGVKAIGTFAGQIVGLSSSLIALSVAIFAAVGEDPVPRTVSFLLKVGWAALFLSCIFALILMQAVIGFLNRVDSGEEGKRPKNLALFGWITIGAFLTGIVGIAAAGWNLF
jgi:hypothetical protein